MNVILNMSLRLKELALSACVSALDMVLFAHGRLGVFIRKCEFVFVVVSVAHRDLPEQVSALLCG